MNNLQITFFVKRCIQKGLLATTLVLCGTSLWAQTPKPVSNVWVSDNGDGTYTNPIIHSDFSDPDVVRVGDDYYMTASSFNWLPGLPILHSRDLVNWELITYALNKLEPIDFFDKVQPGCGVWAPCIRFHKGEYYIYFPDPDFGIYLTKATDPKGPWSEPVLVKGGKGLIDPTPLWDDDGKAYLSYAFAGSRAGIKTILMLNELTPDGTKTFGQEVLIFDGHDAHPTVEGPKFYKRNGYYYIFAPAGGVSTGWQLILRSKNIWGPYEQKVVLEQGSTKINGPHQGAWIDAPSGENWFIHFQDKEAYGRIVHMQPMRWENDWPVMGLDHDKNGVGEPVAVHKKPNLPAASMVTPPDTDEFNSPQLGLQWQWPANPQRTWGFTTGNLGYYRLNCIPRNPETPNLWTVPNLLMQKFPAEKFTATTKLTFNHRFDGEEVGFLVMGRDYQYISIGREQGKLHLRSARCLKSQTGKAEEELARTEIANNIVWFRVTVKEGGLCTFSYSTDGKKFTTLGDEFQSVPGQWIGAKVGYFALRNGVINDAGNADIDWIRFEK